MRKMFRALVFASAFLFAALPVAQVAEAYTYAAALKTVRLQATATRFDSGSLEVLHSDGTTVLATWTLNGSQSGNVSGSVWTVGFASTTVTASATGIATSARMKRSAGNGSTSEITAITVGTSGQELNFNNTNWTSGQSITISSFTITHP